MNQDAAEIVIVARASPLTKIPILQIVFLYASKKLSTPIKLAQVTSSWDETLRSYGGGALVWQKAYRDNPVKVTGFLHAACSKGGFAWVVKHLLAAGVDPNSFDESGSAAIHHITRWCAVSPGAIECISVLAAGGADINIARQKKGQTAFEFALETGQHLAVKELLKHGANPKLVPFALHVAAASGSGECCRVLVEECGYNVDEVQPATRHTPLHAAVQNSKTKVLSATKTLLKVLKADTRPVDFNSKTAFLTFLTRYVEPTFTSSENEPRKKFYVTSIQDWIDANPDVVNDRDRNGNGVLCVAAYVTGALSTLRKLLLCGADVNSQNNYGDTLLMMQVRRWCMNDPYHPVSKFAEKELEFLKILVEEFNAKVGTINNAKGETVFDIMNQFQPVNQTILNYLEGFRKQ